MRKLTALLLLVFLSCLLLSVPASALDGYSYYIPVTFSNSTGTDITGRYVYSLNADGLVDGGFMQADGDDVRFDTESDAVAGSSTIGSLTSSTAVWCTDYFNVPANGSTVKYLWTGNLSAATRDQVWIANSSDTCTASDDNSLDLNTMALSADVELSSTPVGINHLVYKPYNYELYATSGSWTFLVWDHTNYITTLTPNSDITTNLTRAPGVGSHYDKVSEIPPDDATYVYSPASSGSLFDVLGLPDLSASFSSGSFTVTDVTIYWRGKESGAGATARCGVDIGGVTSWGSVAVDLNGVAFTSYTNTAVSKPGGGNWTYADVNNTRLKIECNAAAGSTAIVSQAYAVFSIDHHLSYAVSIPNQISIETPLSASYNGAIISITDGTSLTQAALALPTTNTSTFDLHVCELDAKVDNLTIDDSTGGTYTLNLIFKPADVSATVITDQSSSNNDVAFTRAANTAGVTVTVGGLYSTTESYSAEETTAGSEDTTGNLTGHDPASMEPGSGVTAGSIPALLIDAAESSTGVDYNWLYYFLWVMFVLALLVFGASMRSEGAGWVLAIVWTGICGYTWHIIPEWTVYILSIVAIGKLTWRHRTTL